MKKYLISLLVVIQLLPIASVRASVYSGTLSTGLSSGSDATVIVNPAANPAAGTYTAAQSVSLSAQGANSIHYTIDNTEPTCSNGVVYSNAITVESSKTVKAIACYSNANSAVVSFAYVINISTNSNTGGNTGGGGGGTPEPVLCNTVMFSAWSTCVNSIQTRAVTSTSPTGCVKTSAQAAEPLSRACAVEIDTSKVKVLGTKVENVAPTSTTTTIELDQITLDAMAIRSNNLEEILNNSQSSISSTTEKLASDKFLPGLIAERSNISADDVSRLKYFIAYGTSLTKSLGAGERAGVLDSYKEAFEKLPSTQNEWSDAIKISIGRWPSEKAPAKEALAAVEFKKIYRREPNLSNANDNAAVTIITYGLRPSKRNKVSEANAVKIFKAIYRHAPASSMDWNIVRAIAYSGARK